jgi:hypothetical protein
MFRTSLKVYKSRPRANCRSAREAWDFHARKAPVVSLRLLDGYWGAQRENGHWDEVENTFSAERSRNT